MGNKLSESASLEILAVVLLFTTCLCLYQIAIFRKQYHYPAAQKLCIVLFAMPILIGWTSWANLLTTHEIKLLLFTINAYKAVAVFSFILYIDRLIGWSEIMGSHEYSRQKLIDVLLALQQAHCYLKCVKPNPLITTEQVQSFRFKIRAFIVQFPVTLLLLGLCCGLWYFGLKQDFIIGEQQIDSFWLWVTVLQALSSSLALAYLINYAILSNRIPGFSGLRILQKFVLIQFGMCLTELQPLIILLFARGGLIADLSEYSVEEITAYTSSCLLCSEMILVGLLQFLVFPVGDYRQSPMCRKSIDLISELAPYIPLEWSI